MSDGVWLSVSELAAERGISKQAVSKRLKTLAGKVSTRESGRALLVNAAEYDRAAGGETDPAQVLRNRNQVQGAAARDDLAVKVFSQQRARRESYQAENARLDLEERQGRLCDKGDVERRVMEASRKLRDRVMSFPAQVADRCASLPDGRAIRVYLEEELRGLLVELSEDFQRAATADESEMADAA